MSGGGRRHAAPLTVEARGRIGNQLFMIAAGYAAARRLDRPLRVDLSAFVGPGGRHDPEVLGFDWTFPGSPEFGTFPRRGIDRLHFRGATRLQNLVSRASGGLAPGTLRARGLGLEPALDRADRFERIVGRFQAAEYVQQACSLGMPRRLHAREPSAWLVDMEQRAAEESAVVVIVRLGDYRNYRDRFGNLTRDYFAAGLDRIDAARSSPIWLFCDEGANGLEFLPADACERTWVVPQPHTEPKEHVLLAASHGTGYVISNSTFAWWAGWMSGPQSTVVLPRPWFRRRSPEGIAPSSWQAIPAQWLAVDGSPS